MVNTILKRGRINVYLIGGVYYIFYKGLLLEQKTDFKASFEFLHKNYAEICERFGRLSNG